MIAGFALAKEKPAQGPAPASPAVWRVSDADSAVYLFGTHSVPPEGAPWRSRALARAIDASEIAWFEAPVGEPGAAEAANRIFATQGALPGGRTLSALLAPERRGALAALAASLRIQIEQLDRLKPWAAFVVLSAQTQASEGAPPAESADALLMNEAKGRGRGLRYFESIESSLGVLTKMPEKEQLALLSFLIDDFVRQQTQATAAYEAWRKGDLAGVDAHLNQPMREGAPAAYKRLVADRTSALAADIGGVLERPETAFVALNAGYLVGPDAIPDLLAAAGFKVERVDAPAPPPRPKLRDN